MLLNSDSVVHYLMQRGFLSFDSVVEGDLMVVEAPRRNRNFKVTRQRGAGLFVKQVQEWDPQALATVQREAWCYSLAKTVPELASLRALLPEFRFYDAQRYVLVLELLKEFESLAEYHQRLGMFPAEIAEALAEAMGAYHRETRDRLAQLPQAQVFPKTVPWVLSVHLQQASWFQSISAGNSQLLGLVKKYDQFSAALDRLRSQWSFSSLIHGDIKWDNCMIVAPASANGKPKLKVVDWELADLGDALWDVGAILQSYLSFWILSMPTWQNAKAEDLIAHAPYKLEAIQGAVRAFWRRYTQTAEVPADARREHLIRSIAYGAVRMIQTAYESLTYATQMNANVLYLLQVSMNVLLEPEEAARELFGITEGGR
jgi:hypothetical protein